jgi:L-threonylcarbamoyladenylate synthase
MHSGTPESILPVHVTEGRLNGAIRAAAKKIREGGVVAFPTETVYGLGANAFDSLAVARIFEIKKRPRFDPLIVHIAGPADLALLATHVPPEARLLLERFWPGPLTLVLPKSGSVPDIVTAGLATVAVRMPDHPVALSLLRRAGVPVAAPSANLFGRLSPTSAADVWEQLGDAVDLIIDGGPSRIGLESTVLSFAGARPELLRPGGLPLEEIEAVSGPVEIARDGEKLSSSPGRLPRHYAPNTPLVLRFEAPAQGADARVGLLTLTPPDDRRPYSAVEVLSATGDMREAAANLYAALRRLDSLGLDLIVAEPVPNHGLGLAINDRLRRASARAGGESGRAVGAG